MLVGVAVVCAALFGRLDAPPAAAVGAVLTNTLMLGVCGLTLAFFRPSLYRSLRTVGARRGRIHHRDRRGRGRGARTAATPELVPIAVAGVLFSVLFDSRVSVFASLVLAALIGIQPPYLGTPALFLFLVVGVAASFSVRVIRRRDQVFYSILVTAAAYVLAELAIGLSTGASQTTVGWPSCGGRRIPWCRSHWH